VSSGASESPAGAEVPPRQTQNQLLPGTPVLPPQTQNRRLPRTVATAGLSGWFRLGTVALLALLLAGVGCGYHTAGRAVRLPADLHTIAIPTFTNVTTTYRVDQMMTAAVVREFLTRTRYRVVSQAGPDTDAVLRGTITSVSISPITYSAQTGQASSALVTVLAKVSLVDSHGKVLYDSPSYTFREQYEISQDPATFFQEVTPAYNRMAQDFARTLVSNVLEAF
jgi:outer membrane lipopolysaccharide assembly protein LptE/RlpB